MYKDLNKESVMEYVKAYTDYFPGDANLHSYEFGDGEEDGDGFINFIYRVWDDNGKSVIVKQAKTYYKAFGEGVGPFVVDRNALEANIMRIRGMITPENIPEVYFVDLENHIYVCEDCSDLKILRFELMKGKTFPRFPKWFGAFVARSNFYTSEIFLEPQTHKELAAKFMNPHMRKIFETGLFLKDEHAIEGFDPHQNPEADQVRVAMGDAPWKSRAFRVEMLKLRHIHMKKSEVLVHGDLHTSNILIGDEAMKVIDMEYTFMGASSSDSGYFMGSILYEYIRWFYMPQYPEEACAAFRESILGYMRDFIKTYYAVYTQCWEEDARETYRDYSEYRDYVLDQFFHEMVGFTGCQIISRVGGVVPLPDFDTIADQDDRYEACRISLMVANHLIMHRNQIADVDEMVDTIARITRRARTIFQAARQC